MPVLIPAHFLKRASAKAFATDDFSIDVTLTLALLVPEWIDAACMKAFVIDAFALLALS